MADSINLYIPIFVFTVFFPENVPLLRTLKV